MKPIFFPIITALSLAACMMELAPSEPTRPSARPAPATTPMPTATARPAPIVSPTLLDEVPDAGTD